MDCIYEISITLVMLIQPSISRTQKNSVTGQDKEDELFSGPAQFYSSDNDGC